MLCEKTRDESNSKGPRRPVEAIAFKSTRVLLLHASGYPSKLFNQPQKSANHLESAIDVMQPMSGDHLLTVKVILGIGNGFARPGSQII